MESSTTKGDPYAIAAALGLDIRHEHLEGNHHGLYRGDHIVVKPGLTQREERSVVAHELGHHYYGQTHIHRSYSTKLERLCDLYAGKMLIDEQELIHLAHEYPDDLARIAYELNVSLWLLETWITKYPIRADMDVAA